MAAFQDEGKFSQLDERQVIAFLEGIFFFSLTWSIGATGTETGRAKFDLLVKELQEVCVVIFQYIECLARKVLIVKALCCYCSSNLHVLK